MYYYRFVLGILLLLSLFQCFVYYRIWTWVCYFKSHLKDYKFESLPGVFNILGGGGVIPMHWWSHAWWTMNLDIYKFLNWKLNFRLFINFEKLSNSIEFLQDTMEEWATGCCIHVFLVDVQEKQELAEIWSLWCSRTGLSYVGQLTINFTNLFSGADIRLNPIKTVLFCHMIPA